MPVSMRVVATCEESRTMSAKPQLGGTVSVLRILNHPVLQSFLSSAVMLFPATFGVFRKIWVKEMGGQ